MPDKRCRHCGGALFVDIDDNLVCRQCARVAEWGPPSHIRGGLPINDGPRPWPRRGRGKSFSEDGAKFG